MLDISIWTKCLNSLKDKLPHRPGWGIQHRGGKALMRVFRPKGYYVWFLLANKTSRSTETYHSKNIPPKQGWMLEFKDDRYSTSLGEDSLTIVLLLVRRSAKKNPHLRITTTQVQASLILAVSPPHFFFGLPKGPSRICFCAVGLIGLPAGAETRS